MVVVRAFPFPAGLKIVIFPVVGAFRVSSGHFLSQRRSEIVASLNWVVSIG
jgi:hypothetical protein